ncbi:tetratricopeptide repeat protein [Paenibacillus piri]|uniref:Tetratricopeptide repeat protein n=1 Tax=Paenibacillus piri TaxID=2547395 RepID=A0A4R5KV51_9BACL|nr:tetratricopeptide repeat protein [Paenibacillus piri]TDF99372.1 tetratricopeptide repeat protein [Paenibacillus piri]
MDGEDQIKKAYESILMNDFEQAIEWFEQAVATEPHNAAFHYKLSITYARSNKLGKAIEHAKEAIRLEPDENQYNFHLEHLQSRELIHQAQKYFKESDQQLWMAVILLQEAIKLDSLSVDAFLLTGLAYSQLKEYSQAIRAINELLKLDPQHELGRQLLAEIQQKLHQYMQS